MEDSHDTIAWDSSDNGVHGVKNGWTTGTGTGTSNYRGADVLFSSANEHGHSEGTGSPIPVLDTDHTTDVLGNPADYTGSCPKPGKAINNTCLTLYGTDDYVQLDSLITLPIAAGNTWSITVQSKKADLVTQQMLLGETGTTNYRVYFMVIGTARIRIHLQNGQYIGFDHDWQAGTAPVWRTYTFAFDGANLQFFVDGQAISITPGGTWTGGNTEFRFNAVGRAFTSSSLNWGGQVCGLRVTLNGTEVANVPMSERAGEICHNTADPDNPMTIFGATYPDAWTDNTQGVLAYNLSRGFSLYEHATLPPLYVPFADGEPHPGPVIPSGYTLTRHCPAGARNNGFEGAIDKTGGISWPGSAAVDASLEVGDTATPPEYLRELVDGAAVAGFDRVLTLAAIPTGDDLTALNEWLADKDF